MAPKVRFLGCLLTLTLMGSAASRSLEERQVSTSGKKELTLASENDKESGSAAINFKNFPDPRTIREWKERFRNQLAPVLPENASKSVLKGVKEFEKPKWNSGRCQIVIDNCTTSSYICQITDYADCSVQRSDCSATCSNCTVINPICTIIQEPCIVDEPPPCATIRGPCSISNPNCITTRPPCTTYTPPCTVSTTVICPPVPCVTAANQTCEPDVCYPEAVFCPSSIVTCPPETTTCQPPVITCPRPTYNCPEPNVICPDPTTICTQPQVKCETPVVNCPGIVIYCPLPIYVCKTYNPTCLPPVLVCPSPTQCNFTNPPPCFIGRDSDLGLVWEDELDSVSDALPFSLDDVDFSSGYVSFSKSDSSSGTHLRSFVGEGKDFDLLSLEEDLCDDCLATGCIALRQETDFKWILELQ